MIIATTIVSYSIVLVIISIIHIAYLLYFISIPISYCISISYSSYSLTITIIMLSYHSMFSFTPNMPFLFHEFIITAIVLFTQLLITFMITISVILVYFHPCLCY